MRIRRLDLTRYGRFTDRSIDFGAPETGKPDFHLIVGANEAGKSTLTAAIVDLFFGMGQRSPYGFLHGYDGMQIGAALDLPSGEREVVRVKRGARLRDASGQAIDEGILTAGLSGIDREAYRMMFCLDEETLRMGGESILASQGELGQLLFSASAGLAAFGQRLSKLQETVDAFHKPRGRSTELSVFKARLDELKARKDAINVLATTHAQLVQERDDAAAKYEAALSQRTTSKLRLDEINRYLGILPDLAALKAFRLDLSTLADVPQPPAAWSERLPELIGAEGRIKAACEIASANVERLRRERDAIHVEQSLIDAGPAIDALRNGEARYVAALDISKRESELTVIEGNLRKIAERLDRADELPAKLVLPAMLVGKLRGLIDRRSRIRERLQAAFRECVRASDALTVAKQVLASYGTAEQDEALTARIQLVLDQARASDHAAREKAARRVVLGLQEKLSDQLGQLGSWSGDIEHLAAVKTPTTDQIEDWRRRGEAIRQAILKHASDIESLTNTAVELAATITSIKAATGLVDDATARISRADRDDAWRAHRQALSEGTATAFETALRNDDGIIETRLSQTSLAADLRQAVQAEATTAARLRRAVQLHADAQASKSDLDAEMAATFIAVGLRDDAHLAELERWLMRRASALEVNAGLKAASTDLRIAQEDGATQVERLAAALKSIGVMPPEDGFESLLVSLQTAVDRQTKLRSDLAHAAKAVEGGATELATRQRDAAEGQSAHDDWQQEWNATVGSCWLSEVPSPLGPDEVSQVLSVLAEIPPLESERESLSHRIAAMKRDQGQFVQAVGDVGSSLQIQASEADPIKLASDLRRRLEIARSNERDWRNKEAELERAVIVHRDALEELTLHQAEVETHTSFFGVASLMEVSAKIEEANRRSDLERQVKVLSSRITVACRTETLGAAEATLVAFEQAALEAEAAALIGRLEGQDREAHELHARHLQADHALAAIGGDDAVARLDEERRTVLVELEEKAIQFARLKLGIAAAHQALQSYRDTHRTSMLQNASDAYRTITKGAYSGLSTQPNGDKEILLGVMAAGGSKLATEMSTGARAQLYLALRIAGYHEFAKTRPSLPFIADDILETFDDFRSEEACRLFSGMASTGQVIVATHHHHLIDIARRACAGVIVHEIEA
ncbi:AAA family ATPase (plasmid) [Bosea sp. F3-2]|uniref:AAA family ATPase n=1 Tax=Bosea sp. F3-2 TaxID=2599640 RepID=UPI0011EBF8E6|nr:AAA family ATPase [Bosea sp. F3-2]QEL26907.1 AAA family ATPase [Bosea sp. F3-2]